MTAKYYSTADAAGVLKVSQAQVRALIDRGLLAATDVGTGEKPLWRIAADELDDFANRRQHMSYRVGTIRSNEHA